MSGKAIAKFVATVFQHWPPFRWDKGQEDAWATSLATELAGFSEAVLNKAIEEMVRKRGLTQRERSIPTVAECINYCSEAKRWLEADQRKGELPITDAPTASHFDWTADRKKLAIDLMSGPMGKEAAKDGWIGTLDAFCRKHARLPKGPEINAVKKAAKEFDDAYAQCVRGGWGQASELEKLGADMLKKRKALADRILHGVEN